MIDIFSPLLSVPPFRLLISVPAILFDMQGLEVVSFIMRDPGPPKFIMQEIEPLRSNTTLAEG